VSPRTLLDRLWEAHVVVPESAEAPAMLYVDLHLVHEVTSPQAFARLAERGLPVRRPDLTLATLDHSTPTTRAALSALHTGDPAAAAQIEALRASCRRHGIRLLDLDDAARGIVHVVGPELGLTQPGMTIVCGDSHTSTHGAFGALAFGIGTTEVAHVLATQCLLQRKPRAFALGLGGRLRAGVSAKDLVLAVIRRLGVAGAAGYALEFRGELVAGLSMEARMTLCNMAIEAGARSGLVAPDETTLRYLRGRPHAPAGAEWERASARWSELRSDPGARFERELEFDGSEVAPMITYGTNPAMSVAIDEEIPERPDDPQHVRALEYMGLAPARRLAGLPVDVVFLGSCTNGRLEDLRSAAALLRGRRVARGVRLLVVPGSQEVKRRAEEEGLARVFVAAGGEWRESGCSMCIAMNGDRVEEGKYAVSTSNRNFEGRQGPRARTLLASPATAAAAAVTGRVTDPREFARCAPEVCS
jgi:3-isopropylmalate/(R)-2-methylmalate dehydratase large subunit